MDAPSQLDLILSSIVALEPEINYDSNLKALGYSDSDIKDAESLGDIVVAINDLNFPLAETLIEKLSKSDKLDLAEYARMLRVLIPNGNPEVQSLAGLASELLRKLLPTCATNPTPEVFVANWICAFSSLSVLFSLNRVSLIRVPELRDSIREVLLKLCEMPRLNIPALHIYLFCTKASVILPEFKSDIHRISTYYEINLSQPPPIEIGP